MRRRAVVPYATATSGQPLPYLPLPMARTGVPADRGPDHATDLPNWDPAPGRTVHSYADAVQQPGTATGTHYGGSRRTSGDC